MAQHIANGKTYSSHKTKSIKPPKYYRPKVNKAQHVNKRHSSSSQKIKSIKLPKNYPSKDCKVQVYNETRRFPTKAEASVVLTPVAT